MRKLDPLLLLAIVCAITGVLLLVQPTAETEPTGQSLEGLETLAGIPWSDAPSTVAGIPWSDGPRALLFAPDGASSGNLTSALS